MMRKFGKWHKRFESLLSLTACPVMILDPRALQNAERALAQLLREEADHQRAYIFQFPDGRISLELEWIDPRVITREIIAAYLTPSGLARISHTRCGLRRFKNRQGRRRAPRDVGASGKRDDAPCRLRQPALWVAFRRASSASGGSTLHD
jgi:hypothetical protein